PFMNSTVASLEAFRGHRTRALEMYRQLFDDAVHAGFKGGAAEILLNEAGVEMLAGNNAAVPAKVKQALAFSPDKVVRTVAAYDLACAGFNREALTVLSELQKDYPEDTVNNAIYGPWVRAITEMNQDRAAAGIDLLEKIKVYEFGGYTSLWSAYDRGRVY